MLPVSVKTWFSKTEILVWIPSLPSWSPTSSLELELVFVLVVAHNPYLWPFRPSLTPALNAAASQVSTPSPSPLLLLLRPQHGNTSRTSPPFGAASLDASLNTLVATTFCLSP